MPQPYNGYYIYPPRTGSRIPYVDSPVLRMWKGWADAVAQLKINGNRNLIKVFPDRKIEMWNREKELQKYKIHPEIKEFILDISPAGYFTLWDTELVHTKTTDVKNVIYFFDCLVWESQHLLGITYGERFSICQRLIGERYIPFNPNNVKDNIYIAQNIPIEKWDETWLACKNSQHVEGLVLKRTGASSALALGNTEMNNEGFMCRIRKKNKNMLF